MTFLYYNFNYADVSHVLYIMHTQIEQAAHLRHSNYMPIMYICQVLSCRNPQWHAGQFAPCVDSL